MHQIVAYPAEYGVVEPGGLHVGSWVDRIFLPALHRPRAALQRGYTHMILPYLWLHPCVLNWRARVRLRMFGFSLADAETTLGTWTVSEQSALGRSAHISLDVCRCTSADVSAQADRHGRVQ